MSKAFDKKLRSVWIRCCLNQLIECTCKLLLCAGLAAVAAVLIERFFAVGIINKWTLWSAAVVGMTALGVLWYRRIPSRLQVSVQIDEKLELKERFSSTLALAESDDPFARATCEQSHEMAEYIQPATRFPVMPPRRWYYAGCSWLVAGILFIALPQQDLLGFLKRDKQEKQRRARIEETEKQIEDVTKRVDLAVKQMGDPELNEELDALTGMPDKAKPDAAKRRVIKKLSDLSKEIKKKQKNAGLDSQGMLERMLKQLRGGADEFSRKLRSALAKGEFGRAAAMMKQLQERVAKDEVSAARKSRVAEQMGGLGEELQKLAARKKELEEELEKAGVDSALADEDAEELRKELERKGINQEEIEQLMSKFSQYKSAAEICSSLGSAFAACGLGGGGALGGSLSGVIGGLNQLEAFEQQLMLSEAALAEIANAVKCLGMGMCTNGVLLSGMGKRGTGGLGKGYGLNEKADSGETTAKPTRAKGETGEGPVIASWYFKGEQVKGEAKLDFKQVVQTSKERASEAISDNRIPKRYEKAVKRYFDEMDAGGG